ncbi:hypothetical protein ACHIPZ_12675 [Antrihabitans sp. NCIMB 15449]|uniref:CopG family transcriptional regulator n=1 Tax=Antrihabitans spumae TaxID=3373370 RepID=A0ABW7JMS8_9NOCA
MTQLVIEAIEQYVASLDDDQFADLVARTREPTDKPVDENPASGEKPTPAGYPSGWQPGRKARS